ncbi:MAG: ABC transporter permease, partial [Coriobacteriia bacterium]|nr:ABC transporter permease [Coriobacteriia bacterium]
FWLNASRDVEAGLLPQRAGRSNATRLLSTPIGLAWRLLRSAVIIWAITIPVLGISYGTVMGDMEGFVESNEIFREIFTGDPVQFVSYIMIVITVIGTIPVLQFILKARQQENEGFAENVLVRSASRTGQLTGYFLIALAACFLIPLLNAVGLWLGSTAVMESPIALTTILKAGMVYVPAMLVMLGIAMVLIGLFPRFTSFTWVYLGYSFIVIYFGSLVDLPEWLTQLSPFGFIPQLPTDDFKIFPLMVLVALALLMFVVGFIGYAHRDMDLVA